MCWECNTLISFSNERPEQRSASVGKLCEPVRSLIFNDAHLKRDALEPCSNGIDTRTQVMRVEYSI